MIKILVMGLPGAGKTTLAIALAARLNAVHFNADEVRKNINKDLGFTETDRIEQARRMGWLCDQVAKAGGFVIADFVCPTKATREAFSEGGPAVVLWADRIASSRFKDTNAIFEQPNGFALRVTAEGAPEHWAERAVAMLLPNLGASMQQVLASEVRNQAAINA